MSTFISGSLLVNSLNPIKCIREATRGTGSISPCLLLSPSHAVTDEHPLNYCPFLCSQFKFSDVPVNSCSTPLRASRSGITFKVNVITFRDGQPLYHHHPPGPRPQTTTTTVLPATPCQPPPPPPNHHSYSVHTLSVVFEWHSNSHAATQPLPVVVVAEDEE